MRPCRQACRTLQQRVSLCCFSAPCGCRQEGAACEPVPGGGGESGGPKGSGRQCSAAHAALCHGARCAHRILLSAVFSHTKLAPCCSRRPVPRRQVRLLLFSPSLPSFSCYGLLCTVMVAPPYATAPSVPSAFCFPQFSVIRNSSLLCLLRRHWPYGPCQHLLHGSRP